MSKQPRGTACWAPKRKEGSRSGFSLENTSSCERERGCILPPPRAEWRSSKVELQQRDLHDHLSSRTSEPILIPASMSKDKQETSHKLGADKTTPTAAMPTFDKVAGDEEKPRSELTGMVHASIFQQGPLPISGHFFLGLD